MFDIKLVEEKVQKILDQYGVGSVQVGIIKDSKVLMQEAFGYANEMTKDAATIERTYAIGSTTKAMTSTAVSKLVYEGKLAWDAPVRKYLPWFELADKYASDKLTVKDILCHRCGLARHDGVWYVNGMNSKKILERTKHLQPSASYGSKWQYSNIMFCLAGALIEEVSGLSWSDYIEKNITSKLGMTSTSFDTETAIKGPVVGHI